MLLKVAKVGNQIALKDAKVIGIKDKSYSRGGSYHSYYGRKSYGFCSNYKGIMVEDPVHGKVYFGCSSKFAWTLNRGDLLTAIVTVTGSGTDVTFAKRATKVSVKDVGEKPAPKVEPEKPVANPDGAYTVVGCCGIPMSFDKDGMSL